MECAWEVASSAADIKGGAGSHCWCARSQARYARRSLPPCADSIRTLAPGSNIRALASSIKKMTLTFKPNNWRTITIQMCVFVLMNVYLLSCSVYAGLATLAPCYWYLRVKCMNGCYTSSVMLFRSLNFENIFLDIWIYCDALLSSRILKFNFLSPQNRHNVSSRSKWALNMWTSTHLHVLSLNSSCIPMLLPSLGIPTSGGSKGGLRGSSPPNGLISSLITVAKA
jgi:hypothetical protein